MMRYRFAVLAAGLMFFGYATSASAADLGGNCCADLEERIAELEATTARKGNRKVSLTISGFVAQQVLAWDDGTESNVYITDTGSVSIGTHVRFAGQATIAPGWTAGYVLKLEAIQNDSLLVDQLDDNGLTNNAQAAVANNGSDSPVAVESSYWFVKSDTYGKLSLGKQSSAADNQAILPDGSGSLVVANYVQYDNNAFILRANGVLFSDPVDGTFRWGDLASCATLDGGGGVVADCDGYPNNNLRYDTPVFAGFSASASWGEDDVWAVSGRYSGEHHGFKLAAAIAYNESTDENGPGGLSHLALDAQALQIGAYIQHIESGLFVYGAYGREYIDTLVLANGNDVSDKPEGDNFYIKAGLRAKHNALGHTVYFGEYGENDDRISGGFFEQFELAGLTGVSTEQQQYGLGIVQEIDAAAMSIWLSWRHYEAELSATDALGNRGSVDLDDLDIIKAGALINF
ncbi:MAG: porin [Hyphomicrobium sp.]